MTKVQVLCNKKKFDKIGAKIAVASARRSRDKRRRESGYYWCNICRCYHLTKQDNYVYENAQDRRKHDNK